MKRILSCMALALLLPTLACAQGTAFAGKVTTDMYTATADLTVSGNELVGTVTFKDVMWKTSEYASGTTADSLIMDMLNDEAGGMLDALEDTEYDPETRTIIGMGSRMYKLLRVGDEGDDVALLQQALADTGFYGGSISGTFDAPTQAAMMAFETVRFHSRIRMTHLLDATGIADAQTLAAISAETGGTLDGIEGPVRYEDWDGFEAARDGSGSVYRLQVALKKLGFYKGELTGHFGNVTQDAVAAYQRARGLCGESCFADAFVPRYVLRADGAELQDLDGTLTDISDGHAVLHVRFALPEDMSAITLHPANTQVTAFDIPLK